MLELGSYKGQFTRRLLAHFTDVTCVEASDQAVMEAQESLGDQVQYVNALVEDVALPKKYDNIVLTHWTLNRLV